MGTATTREASIPDDNINQSADGTAYRIATPPQIYAGTSGEDVYKVSDADILVITIEQMATTQNILKETLKQVFPAYGFGSQGNAIENIIHTVNGQYNPTIEAEVGEWNIFGFLNFAVNSHHVIQLVREHEGTISLEEFELVAVDGDVAGAAKDGLQNKRKHQ